jgi:predicted nucleic acid-binding protein
MMIATARSGKAKFLVTNDHDLLDIPASEQARLRLAIVTPNELLVRIRDEG